MRFILNNIKLALNFLFIILLVLVFSCSDKEVKPFVGKKIDIHLSSQSMTSRDFTINIDEVTQNNYWFQKGGSDTHSIPNIKLKLPLKTKFLRLAKKNKAKILNGLDMNLRQAVIAFGYTNKKLKSNSITLKYMRSA